MVLYRWLREVVSERGAAKALVYRDTYLAWRGLLHRVDRRAHELASIGVGKGDWVGLMLGNVPDFLILALALAKLGAVVVPIDPTTATRELDLVLEAAPLRALVTRPRGSELTSGAPPPSRETSRRGAQAAPRPVPSPRRIDAAEVRRRLQGTLLTCSLFRRDTPELGVRPEMVLLTSDSTGDPKGAIRTGETLEAVARTVIGALDLAGAESLLVTVPAFHAYGMDFGLIPMLRLGLTCHLEDEIAPARVAKILRDQEIDVLPGTPTIYHALAKLPTARPLKTKNARFLSAGAPLPLAVAESFREKYGVRVLSCYHTTETSLVAIDRRGQNPETVGKPVEGVEIRLGSGERKASEGSVWVKSALVAARTIGPYETPRARPGEVPIGGRDAAGFYHTGDVARQDKGGRLQLSGREDDVVKVDGKRVALGEVEGCLESFPMIKQAQALVVTDPLGGPMVVARVVKSGACEAEEIIDHCARNLAPYKVPRRIEFCERLG